MGRNDNRKTKKMRRRKGQAQKKARLAKAIEAGNKSSSK